MKKLLLIIIFLLIIPPVHAFRTPNTTKNQTIRDYVEKTEENDVENARDYSGQRPASLNKKPWLSDNIQNMESLTWPDQGGRNNDLTSGDPNYFRYYTSSCFMSGDKVVSGNSCGPPINPYSVDLKYLSPGSIIKKVDLIGPGKFIKANTSTFGAGSSNFIVQPDPNVKDNNIRIIIETLSDEDAQDWLLAAEISRRTGQFVSAQDLIESRGDAEKAYLNMGCEWITYVRCCPETLQLTCYEWEDVGTSDCATRIVNGVVDIYLYPTEAEALAAAEAGLLLLEATYPDYDNSGVIELPETNIYQSIVGCIDWNLYKNYFARVWDAAACDEGDPGWMYAKIFFYPNCQ